MQNNHPSSENDTEYSHSWISIDLDLKFMCALITFQLDLIKQKRMRFFLVIFLVVILGSLQGQQWKTRGTGVC